MLKSNQLKIHYRNNNGSALHIVLIIYVLLLFYLTQYLYVFNIANIERYQINDLLVEKNIELFLIEYYTSQLKNDILLSETYQKNDIFVQSQIEYMSGYYQIKTKIQTKKLKYGFNVDIDENSFSVTNLSYF